MLRSASHEFYSLDFVGNARVCLCKNSFAQYQLSIDPDELRRSHVPLPLLWLRIHERIPW
jgi:hypothetical protein